VALVERRAQLTAELAALGQTAQVAAAVAETPAPLLVVRAALVALVLNMPLPQAGRLVLAAAAALVLVLREPGVLPA
jgi:uncharacterized membrane protein